MENKIKTFNYFDKKIRVRNFSLKFLAEANKLLNELKREVFKNVDDELDSKEKEEILGLNIMVYLYNEENIKKLLSTFVIEEDLGILKLTDDDFNDEEIAFENLNLAKEVLFYFFTKVQNWNSKLNS